MKFDKERFKKKFNQLTNAQKLEVWYIVKQWHLGLEYHEVVKEIKERILNGSEPL